MMLERVIEKYLEYTMLTKREKCLMHVLFGERLTRDVMQILTEDFDIDTANQNYILMLSCLGYLQNWDLFPPEIVPRLKGVHRYHQVRNSMGMPWLIQQLHILNDAGIPVMLIKGVAMRAYYAPGTPRLMWDYDIAVPPQRYKEAVGLLSRGENNLKEEWEHSSAIASGKEELDLHCWIFKKNEENGSDFWERAVHFDFHGMDVCVPSPEDMLIHQLDTQARNFFMNEAPERRMKWLYDCRCIVQAAGGLDITSIAARAGKLHVTNQVRMMLRQFCCCFPELIGKQQLDAAFPPTREYYEWFRQELNGKRERHKRWIDYKRKREKGRRIQEKNKRNWEKYHAEWEKYKKRYPDDNGRSIMTPMRAVRSIKLELAEYQYFKPEMKKSDPNMNLWRYFKKTRHLDSVLEFPIFLIRYILRFFSQSEKSGGDK